MTRAVQLREYRIREGALDRFVVEWREHLAPLRQSIGFEILGAWTVPEEHRFIWLLSHPGGWEAFADGDKAYFGSPERKAFDPDPARLIEEQRTVRLVDLEVG